MRLQSSNRTICVLLPLIALMSAGDICYAGTIADTRLHFTPPDSCKQTESSDWIQCYSQSGDPLTQFYVMVGVPEDSNKTYQKYWTQETLLEVNDREAASTALEPVVSFRDDVAQWANGSISNGGQITQPFKYGVLKNEQGVSMLYASWVYQNSHGVELLSGFYQIWDRGKAISIIANLPMGFGEETEKSVQMLGEALKSIDLQ